MSLSYQALPGRFHSPNNEDELAGNGRDLVEGKVGRSEIVGRTLLSLAVPSGGPGGVNYSIGRLFFIVNGPYFGYHKLRNDEEKQMDILGVKIDNLSKKEISEKVGFFLEKEKFHQIVTVNPEFILEAQKDNEFKDILNGADLNVADGAGIRFAFLRHCKLLKARIAGIDLMQEVLSLAKGDNLSVFIASYTGALSSWKEARDAILKKYPGLHVDGMDLDTKCPSEFAVSSDILFCNFGAPHQEKFIHSLKTLNQSKIRLAMGVGGSFDFLTGKRKRAPKILQKIGLEWLWRFCGEPKRRAKRIWNAVVIFPLKVMKSYEK